MKGTRIMYFGRIPNPDIALTREQCPRGLVHKVGDTVVIVDGPFASQNGKPQRMKIGLVHLTDGRVSGYDPVHPDHEFHHMPPTWLARPSSAKAAGVQ